MNLSQLSYDDMNLSQLIAFEMAQQRLSYAQLEERAKAAGQSITASYLCILVRKPLNGLRDNTILGVAAALAVDGDIVAACAMRSWGRHLQRVTTRDSTCVVVSARSLSPDQVSEVQARAEALVVEMEAKNNVARGHFNSPSAQRPTFSSGLPNPRRQPQVDNSNRPTNFPERRTATG